LEIPIPSSLLIVGLLARDQSLAERAESALAGEFGPVAERSATIPFDFTDYYESEMGPGLVRSWLGFAQPFPADRLADAKLTTVRLEQQLSAAGNPGTVPDCGARRRGVSPGFRRVNLDPGLLSLHNLVLASTKDFAHRVYLRSGIHAEVTLIFRDGRYEPLPWTYPDYKTEACQEFLLRCRERLKLNGTTGSSQLRTTREP